MLLAMCMPYFCLSKDQRTDFREIESMLIRVDELEAGKVDALLADLLGHMPLKAAVDVVVKHTNQPKNQVYQRALGLKG